MSESLKNIKAIIGLGNPGTKFAHTRHNIGFMVLDLLAQQHGARWQTNEKMLFSEINLNNNKILLIKPQTFMNSSGEVVPYLQKKGIKVENILVVHDELELPFGAIKFKIDGSAKGHNGLKSIISFCGSNFARLRIGIGRPEDRDSVPDYVLQNFKQSSSELENIIDSAVREIANIFV